MSGRPRCFEHDLVEPLGAEHERHFVDGRDVFRRDDGFLVDVAEQRDLLLQVGVKKAVGAAQQDVGLDTDRPQVANAVLGRLGFQLAGRADERHEREVNVQRVLAPDVLTELADGFEKRQAFDVADRAADFDQHDIDIRRDRPDAVLDLVGDVRNDLHRAAEVIAPALLLDDRLINLARRPVVVSRGLRVGEPLVMAQIEVGFGAIIGDVDLAVLVRAHRARIDIDIWIELLQRDLVAVALEEGADGRRGEALAERRHHAACHEDVFHRTGFLVHHSGSGSPFRRVQRTRPALRGPGLFFRPGFRRARRPSTAAARVRDLREYRRQSSRAWSRPS